MIWLSVILLLALYTFYQKYPWNVPSFLKSQKKILLVIAHPDDEVMFFGPTLTAISRLQIPVRVLCLSNGNADSLGKIREKEFKKSLLNLGISDFALVNDASINDGFESWDPLIISSYIKTHSLGVNTILTFDDYGISGHPNHISLYYGLKVFLKENSLIKGYVLKSVSIIRKFTSLLDIIPTLLQGMMQESTCITSSFTEYFRIRNSMLYHESQMLWFRYLYIVLSRYMLINDWEEI